jgi:hypothetical protein
MVIGEMGKVGRTQPSHLIRSRFAECICRLMLTGVSDGSVETKADGFCTNLKEEDAVILFRVILFMDIW